MSPTLRALDESYASSVGHRPELEAFHSRKIILEHRHGGAKLVSDVISSHSPAGCSIACFGTQSRDDRRDEASLAQSETDASSARVVGSILRYKPTQVSFTQMIT